MSGALTLSEISWLRTLEVEAGDAWVTAPSSPERTTAPSSPTLAGVVGAGVVGAGVVGAGVVGAGSVDLTRAALAEWSKRQRRLAKNRASSTRSRIKKQAQVQALEAKARELEQGNAALRVRVQAELERNAALRA